MGNNCFTNAKINEDLKPQALASATGKRSFAQSK